MLKTIATFSDQNYCSSVRNLVPFILCGRGVKGCKRIVLQSNGKTKIKMSTFCLSQWYCHNGNSCLKKDKRD